MKELMWKYLNGAYPRIYYKMTKFGTCLMDGNNPDNVVMRMDMVRQLVVLFDCNEDNGAEVVKKWLEVLPTYENILNSANPAVLVSDTTVVNSTL
jgi:hypothetical protein